MTGVTQAEYWNAEAGTRWVRTQPIMDALLADHGESALAAAKLTGGDTVLDVGCGCGATTLGAAERIGQRGLAVGVDLSAEMLALARRRAAEGALANVRFELGDVESHPLQAQRFDAAISRFGIMFFENPPRAFASIQRAMRNGGRFAAVCWRSPSENPWITLPIEVVSPLVTIEPVNLDLPGPFSLWSRDRTAALLEESGFAKVAVEPLDLPLVLGKNVEEAAKAMVLLGPTGRALSGASGDVRQRAVDTLAAALEPYRDRGAVRMGSAAWLVTAHRAN
jgi:SAM-dependent methyltransferase